MIHVIIVFISLRPNTAQLEALQQEEYLDERFHINLGTELDEEYILRPAGSSRVCLPRVLVRAFVRVTIRVLPCMPLAPSTQEHINLTCHLVLNTFF